MNRVGCFSRNTRSTATKNSSELLSLFCLPQNSPHRSTSLSFFSNHPGRLTISASRTDMVLLTPRTVRPRYPFFSLYLIGMSGDPNLRNSRAGQTIPCNRILVARIEITWRVAITLWSRFPVPTSVVRVARAEKQLCCMLFPSVSARPNGPLHESYRT